MSNNVIKHVFIYLIKTKQNQTKKSHINSIKYFRIGTHKFLYHIVHVSFVSCIIKKVNANKQK